MPECIRLHPHMCDAENFWMQRCIPASPYSIYKSMNISSAEVESDSELDDYLILRFVNFAFFVDFFEAKFTKKKARKSTNVYFAPGK